MPTKHDERSAVRSSISNTLDPSTFVNTLVNDTVAYKFKMSIGTSSSLSPDVSDDLRCED